MERAGLASRLVPPSVVPAFGMPAVRHGYVVSRCRTAWSMVIPMPCLAFVM
jgi:hypothetical protein